MAKQNSNAGAQGSNSEVLEMANKVAEEIKSKEVPEVKQPEDIEDWLDQEIEIDPNKRYVFELLDKGHRKYFLPTQSVIFDPIQRRQRDIRYARSAQSIFTEFQNDTPNADVYNPIVFEVPSFLIDKGAKAKLEVMGTDKNLIKFLLLSPIVEGSRTKVNEGQMPLFRMIDREKIARQKLSEMEIRYQAIEVARGLSDEKLRSIAYVMGVVTSDPSDLRMKTYQKIEEKPTVFLHLADDTSTPRKYAIKKALDTQVISATLHPNKLYWISTQTKITDLDPTQDVVDYITAWSLSTDEGQEFYSHLRKIVS